MGKNKVAAVIVPSSVPSLDKGFHYFVPDELEQTVNVGSKVTVPFGNNDRHIEGYVIDFPHQLYHGDIKSIISVKPGQPFFGKKQVELARWMKNEYLCNLWDALKCTIPPDVDTGGKVITVAVCTTDKQHIIEEIESNRIKSIQQIRVLELFIDNECIPVPYILSIAGVSKSVLSTLKNKGFIDFKQIPVTNTHSSDMNICNTEALKPSKEQAHVITDIEQIIDENKFAEALIYGVTGSGKTEVYLQTIEHCINSGLSAIVLIPEIALTPQTVERFRGRFGDNIAILHSRLSMGEKHEQWMLIKNKKVKIVVGARSAVFAPVDNLGMIVIDEEHENTYKSGMTPRYDARDVARKRCKDENAVLLLGSATPSVESYYRAKQGKCLLFKMKYRANNSVLPDVEIADMKKELDEGNRTIFSKTLREEIQKNIFESQQTILFLNRRGYSTFVMCRKCGYVVKCNNCNISMTYHQNSSRLICHYCGYTEKNPEICPKCASRHIRYFGTGTQRVEEDIKREFADAHVIRMDADTTVRKNSHESLLNKFKQNEKGILIGTQMIAKGHDFPRVTLVGVLAADSMLNIGDFRASERTFQLITQVSGRAGRGQIPGRVIVQAYNTEDFSIKAACNHDYERFYNDEIIVRKQLNFPPFADMISVLLISKSDANARRAANNIKTDIVKNLGAAASGTEVLGASRPPLYKLRNRYRWRIIIKTSCIDEVRNVLRNIEKSYIAHNKKSGVNMIIDVNPVNVL